jgi:hypothetical protein
MPISTPRRLSLEATRSFQKIYHDEFGVLLSDDDAQLRGWQLLRFFALLTQPDDNSAKSAAPVCDQGGRANSDLKCP